MALNKERCGAFSIPFFILSLRIVVFLPAGNAELSLFWKYFCMQRAGELDGYGIFLFTDYKFRLK